MPEVEQVTGEWTPSFPGQRPPFKPGNEVSTRHGAYVSPLRLTPRIEEIAGVLRDGMPHYAAAFEPAVQAAAIAGARLERAIGALETAKPDDMATLENHARGWHRGWLGALEKLGLTPLAASRMGLNLALARGSVRQGLVDRYATDPEPAAAGGGDAA
jgi:hypothetical protein